MIEIFLEFFGVYKCQCILIFSSSFSTLFPKMKTKITFLKYVIYPPIYKFMYSKFCSTSLSIYLLSPTRDLNGRFLVIVIWTYGNSATVKGGSLLVCFRVYLLHQAVLLIPSLFLIIRCMDQNCCGLRDDPRECACVLVHQCFVFWGDFEFSLLSWIASAEGTICWRSWMVASYSQVSLKSFSR